MLAYLCAKLVLQRLTKNLLADELRYEPAHLGSCVLEAAGGKRERRWTAEASLLDL